MTASEASPGNGQDPDESHDNDQIKATNVTLHGEVPGRIGYNVNTDVAKVEVDSCVDDPDQPPHVVIFVELEAADNHWSVTTRLTMTPARNVIDYLRTSPSDEEVREDATTPVLAAVSMYGSADSAHIKHGTDDGAVSLSFYDGAETARLVIEAEGHDGRGEFAADLSFDACQEFADRLRPVCLTAVVKTLEQKLEQEKRTS